MVHPGDPDEPSRLGRLCPRHQGLWIHTHLRQIQEEFHADGLARPPYGAPYLIADLRLDPPWRRRPDSNRGTGLCRPLPKPLGHAAKLDISSGPLP